MLSTAASFVGILTKAKGKTKIFPSGKRQVGTRKLHKVSVPVRVRITS